MNYKKAIGFGVLIWLIAFALVSAVLVWYNLYDWVKGLVTLIIGVVAFVIAGHIKPANYKVAIFYGVTWVVVGLILDLLISVRFNPDVFQATNLWLGYTLIFLASLARVKRTT